MLDQISKHVVTGGATVRDALRQLNSSGGELLLVVDNDGRLQRTLTDGDCRRAMLAGVELDSNIDQIEYKKPWVVLDTEPVESALELMSDNHVQVVPQVDSDMRPLRLIRRSDFQDRLFLSSPHLGDRERFFVDQAFESNWVAPLGPNVEAFEQEIAELVDINAAAAVSSGTAALHLALVLESVGPGDLVYCSDLTFVASVNPILYLGAEPVMIDCEPDSWNMSPDALEVALDRAERVGKLPKAIVVANIYGHQADMSRLLAIADTYGIPVIEDAAESLGATYHGKQSGTFGKSGVFSFNGNKIITTSGGGMLVSDDSELIARARFLSTQAKEDAPYYLHRSIGYNYRLSNVLAGIGRGQIRVLADRVAARRQVYSRYRNALQHIPAIQWFDERPGSCGTHWLSVALIRDPSGSVTPSTVIDYLRTQDIEARHVWRPMHMQPLLEKYTYATDPGTGGNSAAHFESGICLPSGSNMTEGQQERVISAVKTHFEQRTAA